MRQLFKELYDDSEPFEQRIKAWDKNVLKLYRSIKGDHSHHQDERTIATLLTYHNPNKYTFYKSSFYKKYCDLLGVKRAKKGRG